MTCVVCVGLTEGFTRPLFINILLWICGILPGAIHAWAIILDKKNFRRLILSCVALFLPPLPIGLKYHCSPPLFLNIFLTLLGWIPGICHTLYVLWTRQHIINAGWAIYKKKKKFDHQVNSLFV
eukprot:TRINITY_DN1101_c0_g2_i6.p2 TRINITY_DN1101_c0_g2~~TRINITY_DN1101_c0_g2_i6.p2  ORF type:complete len:124 (+),score=14.89 TRINITY_DN1101_c0_g2_i6:197-568(+)